MINQKNLIALLSITSNNKSPVIKSLRKEIQKYVNNSEIYISGIELENFELSKKILTIEEDKLLHDKNIIRIIKNLIRKEPEIIKNKFDSEKFKIIFDLKTIEEYLQL